MTRSGGLIECHDCGAWHRVRPLPVGATARCGRCNHVLYSAKERSIEVSLALNLAAACLILVAVLFSFMEFRISDRVQDNDLFTGVERLASFDLWFLAALVLLVSILAPVLRTITALYILIPMHFGRTPAHAGRMFRFNRMLRPWAMMEVYLLGVFIAYTKLSGMGSIEFLVASFAFVALIPVMIAADAMLDPREIWDSIAFDETPALFKAQGRAPGRNLFGCHSCGLAVSADARVDHQELNCPRCGAGLHHRKTDSVNRTMALVLTAFILYIPANTYPIMTVIIFGSGEPDTILSGVIKLWSVEQYPIALLVLFASVVVPMLKLIGLGFLCWSIKFGYDRAFRDRIRLYRVIEYVGRWSMIDIFMISILISLVQLGAIATIEPGPGATAFAAVVIVTMIASSCFDPREMWDSAANKKDKP